MPSTPDAANPNASNRTPSGASTTPRSSSATPRLPVTSVIAAVLSRVARECDQTLGSLGPVTVTVPATWGPTRRHVVADAATAAGLGAVDLVAEPVAAAGYFAATLDIAIAPGTGVVVYDLGGGTFDATVLRRSATGFDVLAVDGAPDLGGLDFDQALAEHLAATFHSDDERWPRLMRPSEPADLRHRTAFMDEVRQAKERLSRSTTTELTIPLLDLDAHLTREELEQVCAPLVERTIRVTQGVIRESGLAKEQIAGLFLVGAASSMPLVATLLHRELGIAPAAIEQPELAVSEGGLVAQHTVSTPISVPSPALPPRTTPAAVPAPSAPTNQTMQLPTPSAPPSQPTPQSAPGGMPSPVTQSHMGVPAPHANPLGQYPTGPVPPQGGSWLKSGQGIAVLSSVAAVVVIALAIIVSVQFLPDSNDDRDASGDTGQTEDAAANDPDSAAEGDDDGGLRRVRRRATASWPSPTRPRATWSPRCPRSTSVPINAMATAELDGANVVITGGEDAIVRIWNAADGALVNDLPRPRVTDRGPRRRHRRRGPHRGVLQRRRDRRHLVPR